MDVPTERNPREKIPLDLESDDLHSSLSPTSAFRGLRRPLWLNQSVFAEKVGMAAFVPAGMSWVCEQVHALFKRDSWCSGWLVLRSFGPAVHKKLITLVIWSSWRWPQVTWTVRRKQFIYDALWETILPLRAGNGDSSSWRPLLHSLISDPISGQQTVESAPWLPSCIYDGGTSRSQRVHPRVTHTVTGKPHTSVPPWADPIHQPRGEASLPQSLSIFNKAPWKVPDPLITGQMYVLMPLSKSHTR